MFPPFLICRCRIAPSKWKTNCESPKSSFITQNRRSSTVQFDGAATGVNPKNNNKCICSCSGRERERGMLVKIPFVTNHNNQLDEIIKHGPRSRPSISLLVLFIYFFPFSCAGYFCLVMVHAVSLYFYFFWVEVVVQVMVEQQQGRFGMDALLAGRPFAECLGPLTLRKCV